MKNPKTPTIDLDDLDDLDDEQILLIKLVYDIEMTENRGSEPA